MKLTVMDIEKLTRGRVISAKMREHFEEKERKEQDKFLKLHPSIEMYDRDGNVKG